MKKIFAIIVSLVLISVLVGCGSKDKEAPIITLRDNVITEFSENSAEPNWENYVSVTDNLDTEFIVSVDDSSVDMNSIGEFNVVFDMIDKAGNEAISLIVEIIIIDGRAPTIVLTETAVVRYADGSLAPVWANMVDVNDDHDESLSLIIDDSFVDMDTIGTFEVIYNTEDDTGNPANTLSVTITIFDIEAPVITLLDSAILIYSLETDAPDWASLVDVVDNFDENMQLDIDIANVDMDTIGVFNVEYIAIDSEGNESEPFIITVNIKIISTFFFDFQSNYWNGGGYGFERYPDPIILGNTVMTRAGDILGGRLAFPDVDTIGKDFIMEYDFAFKEGAVNPVFGVNLSASSFDNTNKIFFRYITSTGMFDFVQNVNGRGYQIGENIAYELEDNTYYHFKLEVYGSYIKAYVNDELLYEGGVRPFTFAEQIYITMSKPVMFDNISITMFEGDPQIDNKPIVITQDESIPAIFYENEVEPEWNSFIYMYDDYNLPFTFTIDNSNVDMTVVGEFEVTYQFIDDFGNITDFILPVSILDLPIITIKDGADLSFEDNEEIVFEDILDVINQNDLIYGFSALDNDVSVPGEYIVEFTLSTPEGRYITGVEATITITASTQYLVNQSKETLDLGDLTAVTDDLTLPTTDENGVTITWESDNPAMTNLGIITRPTYSDGNITVMLTATITLSDETTTKTFEVSVYRLEPTDEELVLLNLAFVLRFIDLGDISNITEDIILPLGDPEGITISWESSNQTVITNEGVVTRSLTEDVVVTLTATATSEGVTDTKVFIITVIMDESE